MKPELKLFFDFEFTSLSPDAQPISLGIVSEEIHSQTDSEAFEQFFAFGESRTKITLSKSFYAEFSDFDLNRCDDWVKENVVSKLKYYGTPEQDKMFLDSSIDEGTYFGSQNTAEIKTALWNWLSKFSDYNIQFVCDCGTFDWYWMLQLLAEWDDSKASKKEYYDIGRDKDCCRYISYKHGLPKLPSNISPVPKDLNDLIAHKYQIGVRGAFNTNREELAFCDSANEVMEGNWKAGEEKHNALWDAKVIKAIYLKLK